MLKEIYILSTDGWRAIKNDFYVKHQVPYIIYIKAKHLIL